MVIFLIAHDAKSITKLNIGVSSGGVRIHIPVLFSMYTLGREHQPQG